MRCAGPIARPICVSFEPNEQKRLRVQGSASNAGKTEQCCDGAQFPTQGHGEVDGTCAGQGSARSLGGRAREDKRTQAKCRLPAAPCEGVLRMRSCRQWQSTGASSSAPGCSAGPCEPTPDLFSHRERASANSACSAPRNAR